MNVRISEIQMQIIGTKLVFLTVASKPLKRADVSARPKPWIVSR